MRKYETYPEAGAENRVLHMTFEHLNQGNYDIGFQTVTVDGMDYHQLTREITLSMQTFREGRLINMLFSNGQPLRVQLDDEEIIPYFADYIEWRYVLSGHLSLEIEGELAHFQENEICFINSSALHREDIHHSECVIINIFMNRAFFNERFITSISLTPLQKFLRTNILHRGHKERYLKFSPVPADTAEIKKYIFQIFNEVRFEKPGYLDISRGYITRLMDTLASGYQYNFSRYDASRYHDTLFASVSDYMKQNLRTVTMDQLIETFHFQSNYFNNLIKRYTGLTYSNYLISLRVERAKELLENTDMTIDEIIWLVGYYNKTFFYRRFTEITGVSPAHYRKAAAAGKKQLKQNPAQTAFLS